MPNNEVEMKARDKSSLALINFFSNLPFRHQHKLLIRKNKRKNVRKIGMGISRYIKINVEHYSALLIVFV